MTKCECCKEKSLNLRTFDKDIRETVYHQRWGKCAICGMACELANMHADHIMPWSEDGKTEIGNCHMLCRDCNLKKSAQKA